MTDTTDDAGAAWASAIAKDQPFSWHDPSDLLAHPLNARRHPGEQRDALRESLDFAGWADVVKVNTVTGHVVDGHARIEEAITAGAEVPVLWLELSDEQERFLLATLDPISALATYDAEVLEQLTDDLEVRSKGLLDFLADQAALATGPPDLADLADGYDPDAGNDTGDGSDPGWLRLEVGPDVVEQWRAYRSGFNSDTDAFAALLP